MLGLIVSPTAIFNSTPLFCTLCTQENQCGDKPPAPDDPGYHMWYVKTFCTHKAVGKFTIYFPYILLVSALVLLSIEKLTNKLFKYKQQLEGFYSLLNKKKENEAGTHGKEDEQELDVVEVWQSFKHQSSVFSAYLTKNIFEFLFGLMFFLWMSLLGFRQLINWDTWDVADIEVDDIVNLQDDNVRVFCDVHGSWYECAGIPTQFYLYVLIVAVVLLVVYVVTTIVTLMYLLCPCGGDLASFMRSYRSKLQTATKMVDGEEAGSKELLGELHEIYYENRDMRLMLDLLAKSSGLAPPLR